MLKDLATDMACLIGCWCATLLYGVNVVLFLGCIYVLIYKRTKPNYNWILISASTIQFLIATAHISTVLRAMIEGFVWSGRVGPATIREYWFDHSRAAHIVLNGLYTTNSLIGDAVLVWRLYVLYPVPRWIIVGPIILLIADIVVGYIALSGLPSLSATDSIFLKRITDRLLATWSLSIAVQVLATSLISWKIWYTSYELWLLTGERPYSTVIRIVVESGLIYTLTTITWLVLFVLKLQAQEVLDYPIGQISSLIPALIIVRVALKAHRDSESRKLSLDRSARSHIQASIEMNVMENVHVKRADHEFGIREFLSKGNFQTEPVGVI